MMNEQIKQIALQVGGSHYPSVGGKNLEKFAELIIAECVKIITPDGSDYEQMIHPDIIRQECIVEIMDHFGMNEEFGISDE